MQNEFKTKGAPEPIDFVGRSAAKAAFAGGLKPGGNVLRFPLPDNKRAGTVTCLKKSLENRRCTGAGLQKQRFSLV